MRARPHGQRAHAADRREEALAAALAEATGPAPDDITAQTAAALLAAVHRVMFRRVQERTLAGRTNDEVAAVVADEAAAAFGLLEPVLGHYAVA
ncbi:hypothetical protein [Streptomyces sp. NPDC012510]|uniref:hypothetical protein n=1 Tax=Streptomyces sp. NPDC012510 TaxID=3364838 RepID=UPI0036EE3B5C